jgi:hypothetical protein
MARVLRTMTVLALAAQATAFVYTASCSVDDLDLTNKKCPCVGGYVCDVATNTCVTGASDAETDAEPFRDAPVGGFVVKSFGPTWTTSRSVRWDWEVSGDAAQFSEYQIVVGATEDAVRRQDSTTTTFDRRINPELGSYGGRDVVPPGAPARGWTVTDRHNVARKVFARLIVRDKEGRENLSAIASADTTKEDNALEIFKDNIADGAAPFPNSNEMKRVTVDCLSGSTAGCLQYGRDGGVFCGGGGAKTCTIEMGVTGYDNKAAAGMTEAQFAKAFLEVAVRGGTAAGAKPHADVILGIGNETCKIDGITCRFRWVAGWSFRPNQKEYRLIQVPLSVLRQDLDGGLGAGTPLEFKHLTGNGMRIFSVTIDGEWNEGSNIGLDQLYVRW